MSYRNSTFGALVALAGFAAFPLWGADNNRFSVAIGTDENLLISAPNGEQVAYMPVSTIQKRLAVGDTTIEVSYGRDATGQLTAILVSPDANPVALHFSAGGKSIDAEKAVVTLTFAPGLKGVLIDPGYVGTVEVDSHLLRARSLADDLPLPAAISPVQTVSGDTVTPSAPAVPGASVATASGPAPAAQLAPASIPAPVPQATDSNAAPSTPANPLASSAPPMLAGQLTPMLAPPANAAPNAPPEQQDRSSIHDTLAASTSPVQQDSVKPMKLYWSEPVTGPDGTAPAVGPDEIKLVETHGDVTVVLPGGETQAGSDGMVVPSGSTLRTAENSSAALFLGGVNSARMMPKCELVVTQTYANSTRTDLVNLHYGAVFSRIGHRDGETENYSVSTPEGTSAAGSSDMLAFRGSPADLRNAVSTTRAGLVFDEKHLLAWNPAPSRGLISDVAQSDLGIMTPIGNILSTYFYYTGGYKLAVHANQIRNEVLTNFSTNATPSNTEPDYVLQGILLMLQPYNAKLNGLLKAINNGTETPAQLTYYHNLITVFFDQQAPGLISQILDRKRGFYRTLNIDSAMLWQDLREFQINVLTPK